MRLLTHNLGWKLLALAVAFGSLIYLSVRFNAESYSTPVGGIEYVPMADGSNITLNTDSRIHISLGDRERHVVLDRGEAFFQVAKDSSRPFVVSVGDQRVIAVGTQFSVRHEGESIQIAVIEGKVRVENATSSIPSSQPGGEANVLLTPGSVARTGDAGVLVQRRSLAEVETQLSWRSGVLALRGATLANAVAEFNRYNLRKMVIQDPEIAALPIEGNFRATNAVAFAHLLESGYPVVVTDEPDRIVLRSNRVNISADPN